MFERFTTPAREAVVQAQVEARELGHGYIGTEHLVLGILSREASPGARALRRLGITGATFRSEVIREIGGDAVVREKDEEALRALGIDVEEVRRRAEAAFGPGALDRPVRRRRGWLARRRCEWYLGPNEGRIPFTPRAKKVLELSFREAVRQGHGSIGTEHILLGLAREGEGLAVQLLTARGASIARIRQALDQELAKGEDSPGRSA